MIEFIICILVKKELSSKLKKFFNSSERFKKYPYNNSVLFSIFSFLILSKFLQFVSKLDILLEGKGCTLNTGILSIIVLFSNSSISFKISLYIVSFSLSAFHTCPLGGKLPYTCLSDIVFKIPG